MGVYVDDLIICGPDSGKIVEFKQQMMKLFNMRDLGLLKLLLGDGSQARAWSYYYLPEYLHIQDSGAVWDEGVQSSDTPMEQRVKLVEGDKETAGCYKVQKCDWKLEVSSAYQT